MNDIPLILKFGIALAIGAIIGLERESHEVIQDKRKDTVNFLGVRTLSLITLLGAIAGYIKNDSLIFFGAITIFFLILTIVYYIVHSLQTKDLGFTTELGLVFAFTIGVLITTNLLPLYIVIAVAVILVLVLSRKSEIRNAVIGIKRQEINAFISYALIALVVLPTLPNEAFTIGQIPNIKQIAEALSLNISKFLDVELINPFRLWTIVALITGVDLAGYVLEKAIGQNRGRIVASIAGGLVSSTATTQSLAQESKQNTNINSLVAAAIFSNLASFFQLIVIILTINAAFLLNLIPFFVSIILSAFVTGIFFILKNDKKKGKNKKPQGKTKEHTIFAVGPALKFAVLFIIIRFISKIALEAFGDQGFLLTSAIASLTGLDAVTINTAELVKSRLSVETGIIALILVNAINLISKTVYSFLQGKKEFAIKFGVSMLIVIIASVVSLVLT